MNSRWWTRAIAWGSLVAAISGCTGYNVKGEALTRSLESGNVASGVAHLEGANPKSERDLLYYLEKGELLRAGGNYSASLESWLVAEERVQAWEDAARNDPAKLLDGLSSVIANDSARRYDGRDYEKVFLNVRLALDHIGLNEWGNARIQIKKMHEREAVIAEFRAKEMDEAKKAAGAKGLKVTSFKELNGYPVETLEAPEVVSLKNSYESAFANYLAGFIYEALGEASLAAPGYRKAAEMRPNNPAIEAALAGLDARMRRGKKKGVDTLIVIESGLAPAIHSQKIPINLPVFTRHGLTYVMTALSWPVIYPADPAIIPSSVLLDGKETVAVSLLTDTNAMARKAISDEMPGIIARSTVRAISRAVAQKAIDDNMDKMGAAGLFASLVAKVATVASEEADERVWRTLPGYFSVARASLAPGKHAITIQTASGAKTFEFSVSGTHALIGARVVRDNLYLALPEDKTGDANSVNPTKAALPVGSARENSTKVVEN